MTVKTRRLSYFCLGLWLYLPWEREPLPSKNWQPEPGLRGTLRLEKIISAPEKLHVELSWQLGTAKRVLTLNWPATRERRALQFFPSAPISEATISLPSFTQDGLRGSALSSGSCLLQPQGNWKLSAENLLISGLEPSCQPAPEAPLTFSVPARGVPLLRLPLGINQGAPPYHLEVERFTPESGWQRIAARWDQGELILKREDYQEKAELRVSYEEAVLELGQLNFGNNLDASSLAVTALPATCSLRDIILEGSTLRTDCAPVGAEVSLSYELGLEQSWLDASDLLAPSLADRAAWRFSIDGEEELYQRYGSRFQILAGPSAARELKLEAELHF